MNFLDKEGNEIIYNFDIHHIHRIDHYHHEVVTTTELYMQPLSTHKQSCASLYSLTRPYMHN